jgi:hypothetical protein
MEKVVLESSDFKTYCFETDYFRLIPFEEKEMKVAIC